MCKALEELMADVIEEREKEAIDRGMAKGMAKGMEQGIEVKGIEVFRKQLDYAQAGEKVGLLLDQVTRDQIVVGGALHKS